MLTLEIYQILSSNKKIIYTVIYRKFETIWSSGKNVIKWYFCQSYQFGNSFGVVYDDLRTLNFYGELKADFTKNITIGLNGTFSKFFTTYQEEAWNLPSIKLGATINVNITKKWFAGANVFYVGERKDIVYIQSMITIFPPAYYPEMTNIKGYFDANLNIGYNHSDRLTGFLKFNNIANQSYQKWMNYPVQGLQVLLGASYKFDF